MATLPRLATYDDLWDLPDDGKRYEIIDGELIELPSPSWIHQEMIGRLYVLFLTLVTAKGLGKVYLAPLDVVFSPHQVVQPDLLVLATERLHLRSERGPIQGAPDLLVEIISPSSRRHDQQRKALLYAWFGIREYWLADWERQTIRILALREGRYEDVPAVRDILRSTIFPELTVSPAELFADLT